MNFEIRREGSVVLCNGDPITDNSCFPKGVLRKVRRLIRKAEKSHKKCHADLHEKRTKVPVIRRR